MLTDILEEPGASIFTISAVKRVAPFDCLDVEYGSSKLLRNIGVYPPHSRRLESVQIIISFTFRALAQVNVLQILAGWLIGSYFVFWKLWKMQITTQCCDRRLSCFSSG
jgi:hypothetical protein